MFNREELQAKTVKEIRAYAAEQGIKFNTKVRKPEMIERLAELATEEAPKQEESTEGTFEDGSKVSHTEVKISKVTGGVVHAGIKRVYTSPEGETATAYSAPCGAGTQHSITDTRVNNAPFREVSASKEVTCKSCLKRAEKAPEEPTEEELDAVSKQARKVSEEVKEAKRPKKSAKKAEEFLPAAPEPKEINEKKAEPEATKSQKKAETFRRNVTELETGWETGISEHNETITEVTAKRGDEVIKIHWEEGRAVNGGQTYTDPLGRTIVLRNASAAIQQAGVSEGAALNQAQAKKESRKGKKGSRIGRPKGSPQAEEVPQEELPFSEDNTEKEIIAAIEGKRVSWANSLSGKVQSVRVKPSKRNRIIPGKGSDDSPIIQFMTESGDCSVRISSIKSVH